MPHVIVALPAYNEEAGLPPLLAGLEETFQALAATGVTRSYVIVNDGSSDGTQAVLEDFATRLPLEIVRHEVNRGLGETIGDALATATARAGAADIILTMDADNTHPPGLMAEMIPLIAAGSDLVIASRYQKGARVVGLSPLRHLMSWGALAVMKLVMPIRGVRDYTCGYRAYRADLLRRAFAEYGDAFVDQQGFQCMADILFKLRRFHPVVREVPMVLRYDLKGGASSMNVGRTVLATFTLVAKRRFSG